MSARRRITHALMGDEVLELVANRFRALGDPSRLRLLNILMQGEHSVQELVDASGLSQTNVSRHLALLRREGVVARERDGNRAYYSIVDPTVHKLCRVVCGGLSDRLVGELDALMGAGI
ncbi:MAG: winged helix-turn-helix transcriptional regulator [Deltaproteobacteria bacterium]|nr:winged helix-turn-helix transcriptional regulator [Deltaproteobacteria bacterium]MBW2384330.1 winged helix-turn-helix transcriptional regulator [Deltaproteobacteria bacterium]MBW2695940.1 winged helix-turn-helix transcriptional regulator [Deltaproteobacteria bacterium]